VRNYSEKTAENIDLQVSKFIEDAYQVSEKVLVEKKAVLEKLVALLLEKETVEQDEFNELVGIKKPEEPKNE